MSVCLSAACLYIPVRSPVCLSVGILSTPLNISAFFYRATHIHSADYAVATCLSTARPSVYLTLRPSIIREASRPAHINFCLLFVSVFQYTYLSGTSQSTALHQGTAHILRGGIADRDWDRDQPVDCTASVNRTHPSWWNFSTLQWTLVNNVSPCTDKLTRILQNSSLDVARPGLEKT